MRLITRSDFDGLVCAVLLREVEQIDSVEFVHPKDVQDGKKEYEGVKVVELIEAFGGDLVYHLTEEIATLTGLAGNKGVDWDGIDAAVAAYTQKNLVPVSRKQSGSQLIGCNL